MGTDAAVGRVQEDRDVLDQDFVDDFLFVIKCDLGYESLHKVVRILTYHQP